MFFSAVLSTYEIILKCKLKILLFLVFKGHQTGDCNRIDIWIIFPAIYICVCCGVLTTVVRSLVAVSPAKAVKSC